MNKAEFDHGIRAAGSVRGVSGSQAAHGSISGDLPPEALRSTEVDIAVFEDPDGSLADLLDGAIGEASRFQRRTAWRLELHDLWLSKDIEFCRAFLNYELVERGTLRERLKNIAVVADEVVATVAHLTGWIPTD